MLIKTDTSGNIVWSKTYGGDENERATAVVQTGDGGYRIAGSTGTDITTGGTTASLVKTDSGGVSPEYPQSQMNTEQSQTPINSYLPIIIIVVIAILVIGVALWLKKKKRRLAAGDIAPSLENKPFHFFLIKKFESFRANDQSITRF